MYHEGCIVKSVSQKVYHEGCICKGYVLQKVYCKGCIPKGISQTDQKSLETRIKLPLFVIKIVDIGLNHQNNYPVYGFQGGGMGC